MSNNYGSVTSSSATLTVDPATILISGDFGSGATQNGPAILGSAGDIWNTITASTGILVDSTGRTDGGFGVELADEGSFTDIGGTTMDRGTTALMQDYAYGYTSPSAVTFSLTGLSEYEGSMLTLVVYAAGDSNGQGATLRLSGAEGGNSGSALTTTATSRSINAGLGVAYNTFTGVLTSDALTITANANGSPFTCVNGFQLLLTTNAPPVIATQPISHSTFNGLSASFGVGAAGAMPLNYQWQAGPPGGPCTNLLEGGPLTGVKSNVLTIPYVTALWNLAYQVIVTNGFGAVTSTPASLTSSSEAFSIPIPNHSFESPSVTAGPGNTAGTPSGWSRLGFGSYQAFTLYPGTERYPALPPPGINGSQSAEIYSPYPGAYGYLYLDTGIKWTPGMTYQLTVAFGGSWPTIPYPKSPNFGFRDSSFNPISVQTLVAGANVPANRFSDVTLSYTATGNESTGQGNFGTPGDIIILF